MDFMADSLGDGRQLRLLNALDDFNREGLGIVIDFSLCAERVVRALNQIIEWHAHQRRSESTMARNTSAAPSWDGQRTGALPCSISNPASPSRTAMSSATTGRSGTNGWTCAFSKASRRSSRLPPSGSDPTATNAPTWASESVCQPTRCQAFVQRNVMTRIQQARPRRRTTRRSSPWARG